MRGTEKLAALYEEWCKKHGLPLESADELILMPELKAPQRRWLSAFILMWEAMQAEEDAEQG